ncbi:MAG: HNH endonuclease [Intestinibacter sp.]
MIIELPEKYEYKERGNKAIVIHDILRIKGDVSFERLMFDLTKKLKGNKCYYCNVELRKSIRTLDHGYPVSMGGPTIVNNLFPCCKFHNKEKNNYTVEQYRAFKTIEKVKQLENFHEEVCKRQELIRYNKGFDLPEEWVTWIDIHKVKGINNLYHSSLRYRYVRSFYIEYGKLPYPIILDRNQLLLSGMETCEFAKNVQCENIPCIILENVQKDV